MEVRRIRLDVPADYAAHVFHAVPQKVLRSPRYVVEVPLCVGQLLGAFLLARRFASNLSGNFNSRPVRAPDSAMAGDVQRVAAAVSRPRPARLAAWLAGPRARKADAHGQPLLPRAVPGLRVFAP